MTFEEIKDKYIYKEKYQSLKLEKHHGLTRYNHSIKVAKYTYILSKMLKFNYKEATIGALLHDYFNSREYLDANKYEKLRIHPFLALNNAKYEYNLTPLEENIIMSHMWPIGKIRPNYKESWCVSTVDKIVALEEFINYKFKDYLYLKYIFILNLIYIKL